jgi:DNA-binding SARP family transcriptional activator
MMISIQLLGGACLRSGDTNLDGPPAQRHRIALLTLVVASWPRPLSRDRAMALLWPERDLANARRLLNLAVHVLRAALGADAIITAGDGLLFDPAQTQCDLHDLRSAIATGDDDAVARLSAGPLLDGFHLGDSVELGYWLDDRRAELARAYMDALLRIAARQERRGDTQGRVGACRRLVAADPHSGAYARGLMLAMEAAGDRAAALQHAREHARRRRIDLELESDAEVAALAERLRAAPTRAESTAPARDRSSAVAVLPFLDPGKDLHNAWFADGLTDDAIAQLSRLADVLSAQSDAALRIAAALRTELSRAEVERVRPAAVPRVSGAHQAHRLTPYTAARAVR